MTRWINTDGTMEPHPEGEWLNKNEVYIRINSLQLANIQLRMALADAISSPMGVVPASAEQFYDATKGTVKA